MKTIENKKHVEKKLAQITVFQVILILSLPSYAQIVKKTDVNLIYLWMGFIVLSAVILTTFIYKSKLRAAIRQLK